MQSYLESALSLLRDSLAESHFAPQRDDVDHHVELSDQFQVLHDVPMVLTVVGALYNQGLLVGIQGTGLEDLLQFQQ